MIIEQVEALKTWLTAKLSPICDAEPVALAKYVCALVKKDKPEQELRDICLDQLDVFLQQNTKPFVNDLFEVLKSKAYIPAGAELKPKPVVAPIKQDVKASINKEKEEPQKKKVSEISSTTDDKENKDVQIATNTADTTPTDQPKAAAPTDQSKDSAAQPISGNNRDTRDVRGPAGSARDGRDRDRRDTWRDERSRDGIRDARDIIREKEKDTKISGGVPGEARDTKGDAVERKGDTREVREPKDARDRERDYRRRRSRSRSHSPRRRDFDDRLGRRRFDDRSRFSPDRRWGRRRSWSRSPRRNRSPLDSRVIGRPRSRSPKGRSSRSPRPLGRSSRSPPPPRRRSFRSRTRSRSPRARSWDRSGSGGVAGRLRSRSLSNSRPQPDSRGSTPLQDNDYISSSTVDPPTVTSTVGGNKLVNVGPPRARCQNFEEKGFCMLGDVCPYDHGVDPVVVEDDTIDLGADVDPYLPEAAGVDGPMRAPFIRGPPPDLNRPPPGMGGAGINHIPTVAPDFFPRREVIMDRPPPGFNNREFLESGGGPRPEPSRIVIPSKRPYPGGDGDPGGMPMGMPPAQIPRMNPMFDPMIQPPPMFPPQQQAMMNQPQMGFNQMAQGMIRKGFDFNRLGGRGFKHQGMQKRSFKLNNMTLEVRKIPSEMNNIAKLNEHFGKFGTLTNIQVKFQGDPGAALISFSTNAEASAAYRSPEPVFNNRFIKLFWHNAEKPLGLDGERETPVSNDGDGGAGPQQPQPGTTVIKGGRVGDGIDHPSLMLPVRPTIPPAHKMSLDNTKNKQKEAVATSKDGEIVVGASSADSGADTKSVVYTSSMGNLKKTVYNPAANTAPVALPKPAKAAPPPAFTSPTAVKTADYVSRMEAIKRIEEERKLAPAKQADIEQKKQELLAKQIEQQKKLLETLEKKKDTMSESEKQVLRTALRKISDAIDTVKYGTGTKKAAAPVAPQQLRYVSNQVQASSGFTAAAPYSRGGWSGRGSYAAGGWAGRGGRGRGWMGHSAAGFGGSTSLDNRPKTVEVKGFEITELDEIRTHFQRFGEIVKEDLVEEVPSVFFTFALRQPAELAVSHGGKFKKKILIVRWNQVTPVISRTESTQSLDADDLLSVTLGSEDDSVLLRDEPSTAHSTPLSTPVELRASPGLHPVNADESSVGSLETAQQSAGASNIPKEESTNGESQRKIRTLSEDLHAGEEEHFKASYSDDDDEDHITVTLSNTSTSAPTIYTSSGQYVQAGAAAEHQVENDDALLQPQAGEDEEDDLSNLDPGHALDFIE